MTEESATSDLPPNDFDDSINLESKVLLALSRLQRKKAANRKLQEPRAISCSSVVQFLKANYSWLDGDINSQVKTVLLSFIKSGIVCVLDNAKYRLLIPNTRTMSTTCSTRITHGPNCCCLFTLKCMLSHPPNVCCLLKRYGGSRRKLNSFVRKTKKKKYASSCVQKLPSRKAKSSRCLLEKKVSWVGTRKKISTKCSFCADTHPLKYKKTCGTCNEDSKVSQEVPFDVFSPRDEVVDTS